MGGRQERMRVRTDGAVTSVTFAPDRNPLTVLFAIVALCWAAPTVAGVRSGAMIRAEPEGFIVVWLLLATALVGFAVFLALWSFFGLWRTDIDAESLTVTTRIGPLQRRWSYALVDVRNLGINERRTRGGFLRRIAFQYRGKLRYASPALSKYEETVLFDGPFETLLR